MSSIKSSLLLKYQSLSSEQYLEELRLKGWSVTSLASELGMTRNGLSKVINHTCRPRVWDIALTALPVVPKALRARTRRRKHKAGPGYRYRDYLTLGALLSASKDVGSMACEGQRGIVLNIIEADDHQQYGVLFETGEYDVFTPDYIDRYLVSVGIDAPAAIDYVFVSIEAVKVAFARSEFDFYPT